MLYAYFIVVAFLCFFNYNSCKNEYIAKVYVKKKLYVILVDVFADVLHVVRSALECKNVENKNLLFFQIFNIK